MLKRRRGPNNDGDVVEGKKVRFCESERQLSEGEEEVEKEDKKSRFKAKHSLDSDEEDDVKDAGTLDDAELDGEEDTTVMFDDGIHITPFNMKEEMEDGFFDRDGNYFEKKDPNRVEDSWLQGVDWDKVEELHELHADRIRKEQEEEDGQEAEVQKITVLKQLLEILTPGESVSKALRRLGGGKKSSKEKWSHKKKRSSEVSQEEEGNIEGKPGSDNDSTALSKLTSLADSLLVAGEYDVYQLTFEGVKYRIEQEEENEDDDLDKLGDALDTGKELSGVKTGSKSQSQIPEVMWEFKWKNEDDAPTYGPYSSEDMLKWTEDGYFKDGVWARQTGSTDKPFYNSRRIDFDLYV
jgi:CD2 antigen cytoplasmic tail-binding protein 2